MDLEKRTAAAKGRELTKSKGPDILNRYLAPAASFDAAVPAADTTVSLHTTVPSAASLDAAIPSTIGLAATASAVNGSKRAKLIRAGPGPSAKGRWDHGSTKLECAITIFQPSLNFCRFIVVFPTTRVFELG
jgi:hypothetical protein